MTGKVRFHRGGHRSCRAGRGGQHRPVSRTALVVIDMINPYDHADADQLVDSARDVVPRIADLIERAGADGADLSAEKVSF